MSLSIAGKRIPSLGAFVVAGLLAVSACTSTEATLDPNALKAEPAQPAATATAPAATGTPAAPATSDTATVAAVTPGNARVQLLGVIGAPAQAVSPFSARITEQSGSKGFAIVPANDPSATHSLKGFLSTSPENGKTVVFYVWDVADAKGNRVHRFSGQHTADGAGTGWAGVTEADMQAIADQTAADFAAWLANPNR